MDNWAKLGNPRWWRKTGPQVDPTHTAGNLQAPECNILGSIDPSHVARLRVVPVRDTQSLCYSRSYWKSLSPDPPSYLTTAFAAVSLGSSACFRGWSLDSILWAR